MKIYYEKFSSSFPNVTEQEFNNIYSWLEKEGFISFYARMHHDAYIFYVESLKNYPPDIANKNATLDTAEAFDLAPSTVRGIKSRFVENTKQSSI